MCQPFTGKKARTSTKGSNCSEEIEDMQGGDGAYVKLRGWASVRANCPIVNINKRAEELLSEEIPVIGLVEIDSIGRQDAGEIGAT